MRKNIFKRVLYSLLKNVFVPVICGELKGKLWSLGCGKVFRFITTTYEKPLAELFKEYVKEGYVVYDIGAHIGYFSLLSYVLTGTTGKIYAFEPNKYNLFLLSQHIRVNKCKNVVIVDKAVSDKVGVVMFSLGNGSGTGRISDKGEYEVETTTLDKFVLEDRNEIPDLIKMDVEGEELNVLRGGMKFLSKYRPILFVSTHSNKLYKDCYSYLVEIGYKISGIEGMQDLIVAY
ncbi:MAG: FkbM family methyltransferase [Endomicrobia bacterium]|nr:FkbM family methyltransferase [Endomicrobiia bacterium]